MRRRPLSSLCDHIRPVHIPPQHLRHYYATVFLLAILQDRGEGTADGEAGAVEGMHELGLGAALPSEPHIGAAGLPIDTGTLAQIMAIDLMPARHQEFGAALGFLGWIIHGVWPILLC